MRASTIYTFYYCFICMHKLKYDRLIVELAWRRGCVMDCHPTARGSIPGGNGVNTELHDFRKVQ